MIESLEQKRYYLVLFIEADGGNSSSLVEVQSLPL